VVDGATLILRVEVWWGVEITATASLAGVSVPRGKQDQMRRALITCVGGKAAVARIDRRRGGPHILCGLYLPARRGCKQTVMLNEVEGSYLFVNDLVAAVGDDKIDHARLVSILNGADDVPA
jgi:hypothetical protein